MVGMKSTSTPLNELETELELKYLVDEPHLVAAVGQAQSVHRIEQCYFQSSLAEFHADEVPCRISVAGIPLTFTATEKQRKTLLAILDQTPDPTVRLRRMDMDWFFTVKGLSMDEGTLEFEVQIPHEEGEALVPHAHKALDKVRHMVVEEGYLWEVDVYVGKLAGLVVAELENRSYAVFPPAQLPAWAGLDVTKDFRYKNTRLASMQGGDVQALLDEVSPRP